MLSKIKNLSLVKKLVGLYSFLFLILIVVFLSINLNLAQTLSLNQTRSDLVKEVNEKAEKIVVSNGNIYFEDEFEAYDDGFEFYIYNGTTLLRGANNLTSEASFFSNSQVNEIELNNQSYLIYDQALAENLFIRGTYNISGYINVNDNYFLLASIIGPILLLASIIFGVFIVKTSIRPIVEVAKLSDAISQSYDLTKRVEVPNTKDEVSQLAKSFNRMLEKVESTLKNEKEFAANLTHELRTPLAILKADLEAMISQSNSTDNLKLKKLEDEVNTIIKILENLLPKSSLNKKLDLKNLETIDLGFTLNNIVDIFKSQLSKNKNRVELKVDAKVFIKADQTLIIRLVNNLLDNAIKFSPKGSNIDVTLETNKNQAILTFSNKVALKLKNLETLKQKGQTTRPDLGQI